MNFWTSVKSQNRSRDLTRLVSDADISNLYGFGQSDNTLVLGLQFVSMQLIQVERASYADKHVQSVTLTSKLGTHMAPIQTDSKSFK